MDNLDESHLEYHIEKIKEMYENDNIMECIEYVKDIGKIEINKLFLKYKI